MHHVLSFRVVPKIDYVFFLGLFWQDLALISRRTRYVFFSILLKCHWHRYSLGEHFMVNILAWHIFNWVSDSCTNYELYCFTFVCTLVLSQHVESMFKIHFMSYWYSNNFSLSLVITVLAFVIVKIQSRSILI